MMDGTGKNKLGFNKIRSCGEQARQDGLRFFWVDTCCIDKSSSAELQEAINSMFRWYRNAEICYVFLADLPSGSTYIGSCRWFTRGWTLQELLAPDRLEFYDMAWRYLGNKFDFIDEISTTTEIPEGVLRGGLSLLDCSVAMRMSWNASRETTRVEDMAYCLFGIFNVNMPLMYGEGDNAFRRLQEEIVKQSSDLTIFAWLPTPEQLELCAHHDDEVFLSPFAPSPAAFIHTSHVLSMHRFVEFSVTNKGVYSSGDINLLCLRTPEQKHRDIYAVYLGHDLGRATGWLLPLRKVGPGLFCRDNCDPQLRIFASGRVQPKGSGGYLTKFHIITDTRAASKSFYDFREYAIHVSPLDDAVKFLDAVPEHRWDITDSLFLKRSVSSHWPVQTALIMKFRTNLAGADIDLIVIGDESNYLQPRFRVFESSKYSRQEEVLFGHKNREMSLTMLELQQQEPEIFRLEGPAEVVVGDRVFAVTVSSHHTLLWEHTKVNSLRFDIQEKGAVSKCSELRLHGRLEDEPGAIMDF